MLRRRKLIYKNRWSGMGEAIHSVTSKFCSGDNMWNWGVITVLCPCLFSFPLCYLLYWLQLVILYFVFVSFFFFFFCTCLFVWVINYLIRSTQILSVQHVVTFISCMWLKHCELVTVKLTVMMSHRKCCHTNTNYRQHCCTLQPHKKCIMSCKA